MKKIIALLLVLVMTGLLAACGSKKTQEAPEPASEPDGGWTVNTDFTGSKIPEDAAEAFEKAAEEYDGEAPVPVAFLGTQVVAGMNYAYLCTENGGLCAVRVYRDLEENSRITQVVPVDIADYVSSGNSPKFMPSNLAGGWQINNACGAPLPEDAEKAFEKAEASTEDISLTPVALLGTQVVAGMNYAIFCKARETSGDTSPAFAVAVVYADLSGGAEITSINGFEF